ncbi:hypothetical protein BS78_05G070300 [Paspalum vaginatum]|nr:hypothetical protein BS78_05G070300 [Paspalum vaginatum]
MAMEVVGERCAAANRLAMNASAARARSCEGRVIVTRGTACGDAVAEAAHSVEEGGAAGTACGDLVAEVAAVRRRAGPWPRRAATWSPRWPPCGGGRGRGHGARQRARRDGPPCGGGWAVAVGTARGDALAGRGRGDGEQSAVRRRAVPGRRPTCSLKGCGCVGEGGVAATARNDALAEARRADAGAGRLRVEWGRARRQHIGRSRGWCTAYLRSRRHQRPPPQLAPSLAPSAVGMRSCRRAGGGRERSSRRGATTRWATSAEEERRAVGKHRRHEGIGWGGEASAACRAGADRRVGRLSREGEKDGRCFPPLVCAYVECGPG